MVTEVHKGGLIANAVTGHSVTWATGITMQVLLNDLTHRFNQPLYFTAATGKALPSYQILAVKGQRLQCLATNPFHSDVGYAAVIGTKTTFYTANLYSVMEPHKDTCNLFPWLSKFVTASDGIVPTWSASLGVSTHNYSLYADHVQLPTLSEVMGVTQRWLNGTNGSGYAQVPRGLQQRAAYNSQLPADIFNTYEGSTVGADGLSLDAGLKRDAIVKIEVNPSRTTAFYGTLDTWGLDNTGRGSHVVHLTGMVQLGDVGSTKAIIVSDGTLGEIILHDIGKLSATEMNVNMASLDTPTASTWVPFRITKGVIGRGYNYLVGPSGKKGHEWNNNEACVAYEISFTNNPLYPGHERPPELHSPHSTITIVLLLRQRLVAISLFANQRNIAAIFQFRIDFLS